MSARRSVGAAIRYPGQVCTLVAHEPPVKGVLPEFHHCQVSVHYQEGRPKEVTTRAYTPRKYTA